MIDLSGSRAPVWVPRAGGAAVTGTALWPRRLAVAVLALTLLYAALELPDDASADASQTAHVNPLNSWIWLGLLVLAMPVLNRHWREVAALLAGNWVLLALFGYFALSVCWALDPAVALRRLLFSLVQLVLFAILLTGIRRPAVGHLVVTGACAAAALADLVSWVVAPHYAMTDDGFAGLQGQKNQAGLLMMYGGLATASAMWLLRAWRWRALLLGALLLMLGLLVATRSTTSQAVVIAAAVVMPLLLLVARWPRRVILAAAAMLALVPATGLLSYVAWCGATGADPMLSLRGVTISERTGIWLFVIDEIGKRPWLGAGYESFWNIDPAVQPSLKSDQWFGVYTIINQAHNGYLDLLATGGIFGFAGGVAVLLRAIWLAGQAATRRVPETKPTAGLTRPTAVFHLTFLLGLVMHNFTESNLFSNNALLMVGLLMCLLDIERWRLARRVLPGADR
jgi:O-antigen ligase